MQKTMGRLGFVLALVGLLVLPIPPIRTAEGPSDPPAELTALWARLSTERMVANIDRLSHPDMAGRQTGTPADLRSANYVWRQLSGGAEPSAEPSDGPATLVPGDGLVSAPITFSRIGDHATLDLTLGSTTQALAVGRDYLPILDAPSVDLIAPLVFVGYGIVDPARGLDEYEGIDVRNRIVLFLRGQPPSYQGRVPQAQKERDARARGAVAYLTATGSLRSPYEVRRGVPPGPLAFYGRDDHGEEGVLPGAWISTGIVELLLAGSGHSLASIQQEIHEGLRPRSRTVPALVRLSWDAERRAGRLYNVISVLTAVDSTAHHETVVLGAHRDHFGRHAGLLFPGADDNASGTAVLLEVARVLRDAPRAPRRSIVFASFSGEEQGLQGSLWYVQHPARPLRDTALMINLDHVGAGNGRLTVGVAGHPRDVAGQAAHHAGLADRVDLYGYFPGGDHVPFHDAGIPTVAIVTGGPHLHFHQPTDRAEAIDPDLLTTVARYVLALVWLAAYQP